MKELIKAILERIGHADKAGPLLSQGEALELANLPKERNLDILALGGAARAALAPDFFNCGIINAKSGKCSQDCAFCAQAACHNTSAPVYPFVGGDALMRKAEEAAKAGAKRFGIVTSGLRLAEKEIEPLCHAVKRIVADIGISVCGSLGMLDKERAEKFKNAGISRYHHNLETSASFFPKICSTHAYEEDLETLRIAKSAGMEICSGGIIGLGENWEQRIEIALALASLDVDSVPINFLNAIAGTRLANMPKLQPWEALRAIAIFRLVLPGKDILIAGGRSHVLGEWQSWLYAAGANGMMVGNYLTTKGADYSSDHAMMENLGVRKAEACVFQ